MNRYDFQDLARSRLKDARDLIATRNYGGAFYLAGMAVECALKACIAKNTKRFDFPDKAQTGKVYSHDLGQLLRAAQLQDVFDRDAANNRALEINWAVAKDWTVDSRYDLKGRQEATDLYRALTARTNGVMRWLRQHW